MRLSLCLLLPLLAACDSSPAPPPSNVSGTWFGVATSSLDTTVIRYDEPYRLVGARTDSVRLTITDNDGVVEGTVEVAIDMVVSAYLPGGTVPFRTASLDGRREDPATGRYEPPTLVIQTPFSSLHQEFVLDVRGNEAGGVIYPLWIDPWTSFYVPSRLRLRRIATPGG